MLYKSLQEIDFNGLIQNYRSKESIYHPSPVAWEDEVLYFLMLDRFSDGKEKGYKDIGGGVVTTGTTPMYEDSDCCNAVGNETAAAQWREAGLQFVGGTLKGLESKIGYLKRMGITAIWISPIFKQVTSQETYHGYGIQNFIDVDPRFGTRDDLKNMVKMAHKNGIRIILDIILNHTGDVFEYNSDGLRCDKKDQDGQVTGKEACWQADGTVYDVAGYRDSVGKPTIAFYHPNDLSDTYPNGAVWPSEFQAPVTFTRKGKIKNWDNDPEFYDGDFETLKNIHLGSGNIDNFQPSQALIHLSDVYKFWIAFADIDGYRVDTVKHMEKGATRMFASSIHEFAQSIGKENFYLIGEITGGRTNAYTTMELTGLNAALGINDIPDKIEYLAKGYRNPNDYFSLFRNSELVQKDSHVWFGSHVVTTFDDHDQVRKGKNKARFSYNEGGVQKNSLALLNALGLTVLTMGIPCVYYGTEQYFNGHGGGDAADRYLREAMFGGDFGAFASTGRHFFNEEGNAYQELAKILKIRKDNIELRRGRQYLRQISGDGVHFGLPVMYGGEIRSVIPWSRIFNNNEILVAINTDYDQPRTVWVTIDNSIQETGNKIRFLYSTDTGQTGEELTIEARNGKAIHLTLPAGGLAILR